MLAAADASTHRQLLGLDLLDPRRGLLLPGGIRSILIFSIASAAPLPT